MTPAMAATTVRPVYELRATNRGVDDLCIEIWQMPCAATPQITTPLRVAGLHGKHLALVERQVLTRLKRSGIMVAPKPGTSMQCEVGEEAALNVGLLFRLLAPMRSPERMRQIAAHIDTMPHAETSYWLGMAMHRKNPRRVLSSLRLLLTDPSL